MIEYERVQSSNLAEIGYDPDTRTLAVRFRNGTEYHYEGVGQAVFDGLHARSKGTYFHLRVKEAGYRCVRVR